MKHGIKKRFFLRCKKITTQLNAARNDPVQEKETEAAGKRGGNC